MTFHEDKVYPPQYWGDFPLYFFGSKVGASVTVTNNGPRAKEKLRRRLAQPGARGATSPPYQSDATSTTNGSTAETRPEREK